jgi:hypothetical protein
VSIFGDNLADCATRARPFRSMASNWQGQTGSKGPCNNGNRTGLFVFELR